jgi:UDP-N-acetylglucosamine acyltransferase
MAKVHPTAVLEGDVILGDDVVVGAMAYLKGPIVIGEETSIGVGCVIGTEGEHKTRPPAGVIRIGKRSTIRELTVIQRGTGDRDTSIGDDCYLMDHCHIAHDSVVHDGVTISPNVVFAGHTHVHEGATVGISVVTHQFSTIGAFAMVGMGSVITRDVQPFCVVAGNPARFLRFNLHQMTPRNLKETDFTVADGRLTSTVGELRAVLARFEASVRRKVLPIERVEDQR